MVEARTVRLINIKYDPKVSVIGITLNTLENYAKTGLLLHLNSESAPKELEVTIKADFDNISEVMDKAQAAAEADTELKIKSFRLLY